MILMTSFLKQYLHKKMRTHTIQQSLNAKKLTYLTMANIFKLLNTLQYMQFSFLWKPIKVISLDSATCIPHPVC